MKRKLIFLFALVVAMGTNVQAQSLKNDYKLPDSVPAEVQADDFRMVREDFACFYNAQYKGHLKAKDILVEGVEGYEMPGGGYALVFFCKLPGEQTMQFGVYAGGVPMMNGGMGTKVVTCDVHPGFT